MSKARGLADLGNAFDDGALSNRNILINGNFSISQRGDFTTASTWGSGYLSYSLDRWTIKRSSMTGTIQDVGNRVKVVATTPAGAGSDQMMIQQNIEDKNINTHAGKTLTLSALVKTNRSDCRVMYELSGDTGWMGRNVDTSNNQHSGSGSDERLTVAFSLPSDMTGVNVRVYVGFDSEDSVGGVTLAAGDYFEAAEVQLELGDTATPFEHRSYSDELQRCKRYCQKIRTGTAADAGFGMYHSYTGSSTYAPIQLPVTMRATPSASITNGNAVTIFIGGTNYNPTNTTFINASPSSVEVRFTTTGNATAGDTGWYRLQAAFTMILNAEL